jgi:hypothetical protein
VAFSDTVDPHGNDYPSSKGAPLAVGVRGIRAGPAGSAGKALSSQLVMTWVTLGNGLASPNLSLTIYKVDITILTTSSNDMRTTQH